MARIDKRICLYNAPGHTPALAVPGNCASRKVKRRNFWPWRE